MRTRPTSVLDSIFVSSNMLLAMVQYNRQQHDLLCVFSVGYPPICANSGGRTGELYAPIPLLVAATAQWISGGLVTWLYNKGYHVGSRRIPAMLGFALGAVGLLLATQCTEILPFIICFSIAILGVGHDPQSKLVFLYGHWRQQVG